jgi:Tfp pilus assembly protein PilN
MYATLNISATSLRLLSVKGRQVEKWGEAHLAPGLVRDGLILEPKAVGEAITALFKSTGIPGGRVIICLTGLSFTYRILSLPRMKPALLGEAIQRGLKREIPLPLEELYLSWQAIGGRRDELDFFVLGVPRNLVDAAVQTLAVAGVEPYLMDLKSLALARAANRENAIIVALEPDCFDVVLVTNGLPAIMHTISPRGAGATLEDNIQRLTDELAKTVKFYDDSYPANTLSPTTPLLLTGELSDGAVTSQLIQVEVEYPVEPLVPPLSFPSDLPLALYAANIGLALKKVPQKMVSKGDAARFQDINLNILSGKYRKPRAQPILRRYKLGVLALIIIICLLFPVYQFRSQAAAETIWLQTELNRVSQELDQARLAVNEASQVEDTISAIVADAGALRKERHDILATRGSFTDNLRRVTGALPTEAYFTYLDMGADQITVQGNTDSPFRVISYVTALETQEDFSEVRINEINELSVVENEVAGAEASEVTVSVITFDIVITK